MGACFSMVAPNPADRRQRHPAGHRPRGSEPGLTLERLGRFDFRLPSVITEHLGAGYDLAQTRGLLDELGCEAEVARSWVAAWLPEVQADLVAGKDHWETIAAMATGPAITPLRAMDMVTWRLIHEKVVRVPKKGRR
jgi:hypothetical protein